MVAKARQKPSIAAFGDSNCVGYREGPAGTKRYLDKCLRRSFHLVAPALGRTRLTILQSRTQFLPWSRARAGDASACEADYALVVLGTNDITQLQGRAMEWSEGQSNKQIARRLRGELRAALRWVRGRTRRKIFVVEPVNEMRRKVAHRQLVADAMKAEVASLGGVTWIPMAWSDADLQRRRSERGMQLDPRHFNRAAARRIVESVEHAMRLASPRPSKSSVATRSLAMRRLLAFAPSAFQPCPCWPLLGTAAPLQRCAREDCGLFAGAGGEVG